MKQLIKSGLLSGLALSASAYAVNPVEGFYIGLIAEGSTGASDYQGTLSTPLTPLSLNMTINNSKIGGGAGGMLGYRYSQFRIEGELLYNWIGSGTASNNSCMLQSPTVQTPTGICVNAVEIARLGFNGSVATVYGFANAYWDFINYNSDNSFYPYIGAGIGYARVKNSTNFVITNTAIPGSPSYGFSATVNSGAAQGILGVGLFLDDFTWAGLDYRYVTTRVLNNYINIQNVGNIPTSFLVNAHERYVINTINFTINLSFDTSSN